MTILQHEKSLNKVNFSSSVTYMVPERKLIIYKYNHGSNARMKPVSFPLNTLKKYRIQQSKGIIQHKIDGCPSNPFDPQRNYTKKNSEIQK